MGVGRRHGDTYLYHVMHESSICAVPVCAAMTSTATAAATTRGGARHLGSEGIERTSLTLLGRAVCNWPSELKSLQELPVQATRLSNKRMEIFPVSSWSLAGSGRSVPAGQPLIAAGSGVPTQVFNFFFFFLIFRVGRPPPPVLQVLTSPSLSPCPSPPFWGYFGGHFRSPQRRSE